MVEFISDMKKIPHKAPAVTADITTDGLNIYKEHDGPMRLHYFDSHFATAKNHGLPLITSDRYLSKTKRLSIDAIDVRDLKPQPRTKT